MSDRDRPRPPADRDGGCQVTPPAEKSPRIEDYRDPAHTGNGKRWMTVHDGPHGGKVIGVWKDNRTLVSVHLRPEALAALLYELQS